VWRRDAVILAIVAATPAARADEIHFKFVGGYKLEPWLVGDDSQDRKAFSEIRPSAVGWVYRPWITFDTSVELANNPPYLLDAYVDAAPWTELGGRVGQFKTPFSRGEEYGPEAILFPDQPVVSSYFWTGRDKGAMATGTLDELHYWLGGFGGSPVRQTTTLSGNYLVEARLTYGDTPKTQYPYIAGAPLALSATVEGYTGRIETAIEGFDPSAFEFTPSPSGVITRRTSGGVDAFLQAPTFAIFGEAFYGRTHPNNGPAYRSWGVWAQASYLLVAHTLDIGVRGQYLDPSTSLADDTFESVEGQLAWYIDAPRLAVRLRYGLAHQHKPADPGDVALPVSVSGTIQIFTLQLTLSL
jgi:hypothetical protein